MKQKSFTKKKSRTHGTPSAYKYHLRLGEKPCEECRLAWNAYRRDYRRAHPEVDARYRYAHKDELNACRREWYQRKKSEQRGEEAR